MVVVMEMVTDSDASRKAPLVPLLAAGPAPSAAPWLADADRARAVAAPDPDDEEDDEDEEDDDKDDGNIEPDDDEGYGDDDEDDDDEEPLQVARLGPDARRGGCCAASTPPRPQRRAEASYSGSRNRYRVGTGFKPGTG